MAKAVEEEEAAAAKRQASNKLPSLACRANITVPTPVILQQNVRIPLVVEQQAAAPPLLLLKQDASCSAMEQQPSPVPTHEHDRRPSLLPLPACAFGACDQKQQDRNREQSCPVLATGVLSLHSSSLSSPSTAAFDPPSLSLLLPILPLPTVDSMSNASPLARSMVHDPSYIKRWLRAISEMELAHQSHAASSSSALPLTHVHINKQQALLQQLTVIRQHIAHGVRLDLLGDTPPPLVYANSPSVAQHSDAVRARLAEYMDWGAVQPLASAPVSDRIQPLLVVLKPGRKPRLCIDLSRNLNEYLILPRFSYTNVSHAVKLSSPGCWYCKLDLTNCYFSFPLHPDAVPHPSPTCVYMLLSVL